MSSYSSPPLSLPPPPPTAQLSFGPTTTTGFAALAPHQSSNNVYPPAATTALPQQHTTMPTVASASIVYTGSAAVYIEPVLYKESSTSRDNIFSRPTVDANTNINISELESLDGELAEEHAAGHSGLDHSGAESSSHKKQVLAIALAAAAAAAGFALI
ncbi:hypothetical protein FB645_004659 [Coemansia sp. IMI 203386]|nr:hypothetical protein FB645_004659 [Coemansia sp. IMI 203386]